MPLGIAKQSVVWLIGPLKLMLATALTSVLLYFNMRKALQACARLGAEGVLASHIRHYQTIPVPRESVQSLQQH